MNFVQTDNMLLLNKQMVTLNPSTNMQPNHNPPCIPQLDGFIDPQQCMLTLNSFSRAEERKKEREDDMENFKRMMQSKFGF